MKETFSWLFFRSRAVIMWIQIRTMDGKRCAQVDNLSKLTRIDDLKKRLVPLFDVEPLKQRLFYRGKQVNLIIFTRLKCICY